MKRGDHCDLSFTLNVPMSEAARTVGPASPYWPWALLNGCRIELASDVSKERQLLSDEERQERRRAKWRRNYKTKYTKYREQENKRWHTWYDANRDDYNAKRRERRKQRSDRPHAQCEAGCEAGCESDGC